MWTKGRYWSPASFIIWPFISWFANHHVTWRATVKNRCHHVPWELVCGFGTIIGSGGSSGIWKMHRKYVSWRNTLRSEPLFSPPLYFQSKEVTSVHAPHAWDAREPQPMGVPHDGRAQCLGYTQRPRMWGKWGNLLPNHPARSPPGLLQGKTETKKAITAAPYPQQDSKIWSFNISAGLAQGNIYEISGPCAILLNSRRSSGLHSLPPYKVVSSPLKVEYKYFLGYY